MRTDSLSLDEWLAQIETYSPREIDLGLERVETLLQRLDLVLPETVFHVAGTNGKGSSAAMLDALLRTIGARVGCYTSPHLLRYNERIRLGGVEATDAQIVAAFELIESVRGDVPLTYFEFGTLAAMAVFATAGIEIAVLEVGMGGRLDAVNAIEPMAGLITNVSLDHCAWLGDDIEAVAREKAGIMRAIKPVVFAARDIPSAIIERADAEGSRLIAAGRDYQWSIDGDRWSWLGVNHALHDLARPSMPGDIQVQNAAGVLALLEAAGFDTLLSTDVIDDALGRLQVSGRMQTVGENWLLDVAHNPAASDALADTLRGQKTAGSTIVILGMLDDKDVEGVVMPLSDQVDQWIAVTADSSRATPAEELARRVANTSKRPCLISNSLPDAIEHARDSAGTDGRILITGSFYVVGEALRHGLYSPPR
jgi:dihydrofolate synthase/folylpolyglutamate synthase